MLHQRRSLAAASALTRSAFLISREARERETRARVRRRKKKGDRNRTKESENKAIRAVRGRFSHSLHEPPAAPSGPPKAGERERKIIIPADWMCPRAKSRLRDAKIELAKSDAGPRWVFALLGGTALGNTVDLCDWSFLQG